MRTIVLIALFSVTILCRAQPGTKLWEVTLTQPLLISPAIGPDGTVYACCGNSDQFPGPANTRLFYAISPQGTTNWTFLAGTRMTASPAVGADGTVYFGAWDGLYALSPVGATNWVLKLSTQLCSSPALGVDGTIYVVTRSNVVTLSNPAILHAVSPTGTLNWKCAVGGGGHLGSAQCPSPSIGRDGSIYVPSQNGQLYSISHSGSTNWVLPLGGVTYSSPAIARDGTIYIGDDYGKVHAIDGRGFQRWENAVTGIVESTPTIDQAGNIYFGSLGGVFYCRNSAGGPVWSASPGAVSASSAIAADGTVYVCSWNAQKLFAYNSAGSNLWSFTLSGSAFSSPVIATNGTVYVGGGSKLYAIAGTAPPQNSSWPMFRRDSRQQARSIQCAIEAITPLPDGNVELQLQGDAGRVYQVESSSDLMAWETLASFSFAEWNVPFVDASATNFARRYYRLSTSQ